MQARLVWLLYWLLFASIATPGRVVLVEVCDRVGGHAWIVTTPAGEEVDMGFMVLNDVTYPNMLRVYREIGAEVEKSDMSLSVHNGEDFSWSFQENLARMFRSVVDPKMWKLVWNYKKFTKKAITVLSSPEKFKNLTVGEFCKGLDETMANKMDFCLLYQQCGVSAMEPQIILLLYRFFALCTTIVF